MIEPQQSVTERNNPPVGTLNVLEAIHCVAQLCRQAQQEHAEPSIAYVSDELGRIKDAVRRAWPLPAKVKRQIDLGPFAAKNIEDWNAGLAEALANLDYTLQNDGAMIDKLLRQTSVAEPVLAEMGGAALRH